MGEDFLMREYENVLKLIVMVALVCECAYTKDN